MAAAPAAARPRDAPRRPRLVLFLLLLAILCVIQLLYWIVSVGREISEGLPLAYEEEDAVVAPDTPPVLGIGPGSMLGSNWRGALAFLRRSRLRYVVIDAKNGLGNRLRALASAMSVAEHLGRPVLLIWVRDLHLNCSVHEMFAQPLPFALLEAEIPQQNLSRASFQFYNYMRPEPGAIKDELVEVDRDRHLFFRSAFVMNHPQGMWQSGGPQRQIRRLRPAAQARRPPRPAADRFQASADGVCRARGALRRFRASSSPTARWSGCMFATSSTRRATRRAT